MAGCSVTSQINAAIWFFSKAKYLIWSVHLIVWGLYRPRSMICSGTGQLANSFESMGTVPTTENDMLGDWSTSPFIRKSGDCTGHRAWYAQGLVDQPAHSKVWGLYRPPSMICLGTGRPVRSFKSLGIAPTTEHDTFGDWSVSLLSRKQAWYYWGLVNSIA